MSLMRKCINSNKQMSKKFWNKFKFFENGIYEIYYNIVKSKLNQDMLIYDIGGGKNCAYANEAKKTFDIKLYAIDISDEELSTNCVVDGKIVSDVTIDIPTPYGKVDIITSSSVLEHLVNQEAFIKNANKSLKQGGYLINVFPSKFALFAIINQLLPKALSRKILFFCRPESKRNGGFPAYYKDTYYSRFIKLLNENGFEIEDVSFQYYQSAYFDFFFPFYLASYLWDLMCYILKIKNLTSYLCVTAIKK